jgi:glycerol kinase
VGLTRHSNRAHIARAALEAVAYQTRDVLEAMRRDSGLALASLKVDGGMTGNQLLMQFQADILNTPVTLPQIKETTALGAAYAAGLAIGFWQSPDDLQKSHHAAETFTPTLPETSRNTLYHHWTRALQRSLNWIE